MNDRDKVVDFSANPRLAGNTAAQGMTVSCSTWTAFRAGMQILQRYASHAAIDVHAVARSNLQLLHRSLSRDCHYLETIENIQHGEGISSLPTLQRLYTDQELVADLLTVQDGESISLMPLPYRYTMYLLISGNAHFNTSNAKNSSMRHWWHRVGAVGHKDCLRSGAVLIPSSKQQKGRLTATRKNCVILRVHTPMPMIETGCKIAL